MELKHLRYVIALAEELHFGRAAARLSISQPPFSYQIKRLEQQIGVELFHRTKRSVKLTEPGKLFVEKAREVLNQADNLVSATVRASRGEIGHLMIGTVTATDSGFHKVFVEILRVFVFRYPGVRLQVRHMATSHQEQALRDGGINIGFVNLPVIDPVIRIEKVRSEDLALAVPDDHPLAKKKRIPLRALASQPFILSPRHLYPGFYDQNVSWCRNAGFTLNVTHESDGIYTSLALVGAGLGVCLLPASLQEVKRTGVTFVELQRPCPMMELGVAYMRHAEPSVVKLFLEVVKEIAAKQPRNRGNTMPFRKAVPEALDLRTELQETRIKVLKQLQK